MPEPHKGESREDWMKRCMSDPEQRKSFPDEEQAAAVCESKFRQAKKKKKRKQSWPAQPEWLRPIFTGRASRVDRTGYGALLGYVVAQEGPFKSEGRGEFDRKSLEMIVQMGNDAKAG